MATKKQSFKKTGAKTKGKAAKTSAEKKTSSKNASEKGEVRLEKLHGNYLILVLVFALFGAIIFLSMLVSLVSFFTNETALLGYLTKPFLGLWGICTPFIGIYSIAYSYFCYKYRDDGSVRAAKGMLLVLNLIFLLGTLHLLYNILISEVPENVKEYWNYGLKWQGGGLMGGCIGWFLSKLLHRSVGLVVGIVTYAICLTFFCGSSPVGLFRKAKHKARNLVGYISQKTKQSMNEIFEDEEVPIKETKPSKETKKAVAEKPTRVTDSINEETLENKNAAQKKEEEKTVITPSLYVPDSIYDAPNPYTAAVNDAEPSTEEKEPVKNKFGFKMGREARDENGEIPQDVPVKTETSDIDENQVGEEIEEIEVEGREFIPSEEEENAPPVYIFPPIELLERGKEETTFNTNEVEQKRRILLATLEAFKVKADVVNISCGPTITRYEIEPEMGVSVKSIEKLGKDLALRLAAKSLRIEAPIPGKCAVGIEVSNTDRLTVKLRDILDSPVFRDHKSKLFCCLGVDVAGNAVYFDIPKMPHLLIAGATGMGKSVCLNCIIISLLYRATPQDVRLILIDPKKVEFSHYADLPHLLAPVVTNINKCAGTLNWAVAEMERRYDLFEAHSLRNLEEYQAQTADDPESEKLASIVIVIDELADLMMQAGAEVENSICRLAQKARAAGMYLILGTQRPSVDVITGLIKANIPSRISLAVTSQVDSRTILDSAGAENLLDKGDILFAPAGARKALRVQGAFVSTKELNSICDFVRSNSTSKYDENVIARINEEAEQCGKNKKGKASESAEKPEADTKDLELMIAALDVGFEQGTISTSYIQRRLSFGYAKAARVVDLLQQNGFVSPPDPVNKLRKIIISPQEFAELKLNRNSPDKKEGGTE